MKKLLLLACILISHKSFALELAKYPIELSSGQGTNVVIAPTTDKKQALVKVTGINHDIDGIVFLTDLKPHGSNNAYKYTYDGSERSLISVDDGYRCCSYTLYIPDTRDGTYLSKKEESNPAIVEDLKAQYEQQLAKGIQGELAKFNRGKHLGYQQKNISAANDEVNKQCGLKIKTTLNWESLNDANLKEYAVGSFCAQVAKEMAYMCEDNQNFKSDIAQFNTIECTFTDELKLRKNGNTIIFKTTPKAPNQREFIKSYLLNL